MKTVYLVCLALLAGMTARADFSYTTTEKSGASVGKTTKYFLKGQKMMTDSAETTMIMDFDAQTMTSIDKGQKTFSVMKFSDLKDVAGALSPVLDSAKIDVKETGQRRNINGYDAKELVMTMEMGGARGGTKLQMETRIWISSDVPGGQEFRAFYQKNIDRFPWAAMGGQASLRRKIALMDGVTVLQVTKTTVGSDPQNAQLQAQMEEMLKNAGPEAQKAMASLGAAARGGRISETATESSNFSTRSIPDATFAIPVGFQRVDRK